MKRHLRPEEFAAYASGRVEARHLRRIDTHLAACAACRQKLESMLGDLPTFPLVEEILATEDDAHLSLDHLLRSHNWTLREDELEEVVAHLYGCPTCHMEVEEAFRFAQQTDARLSVLFAPHSTQRTPIPGIPRWLLEIEEHLASANLHVCSGESDLPPALPPYGEPIPLTRSSLRLVRQQIIQAAIHEGLSQERRDNLVTASHEAALNAVLHIGGGVARIGAGSGRVQVWVQDPGAGIEPGTLPRATLERGYSTNQAAVGQGIPLMSQTAGRLYFLSLPKGTTVVVESD